MTRPFSFSGPVPASKSILNRLLVLRSFAPALALNVDSDADDVSKMKAALASLRRGEAADCGAAGTTLRFLALRASRMPGRHVLTGSPRLFARPQDEILRVLSQLGRPARLEGEQLQIEGGEWSPKEGVRVDRSMSSQFASALVLSGWGLATPLRIELEGESVSGPYLDMTLRLARDAGMNWRRESDTAVSIPAGARILAKELSAEIDVSSAFAIAALAAVAGRAEIQDWPGDGSLQPDVIFPVFLGRMGCRVSSSAGGGFTGETLVVEKPQDRLRGIEADLRDSPDLFPVLATLCAFAEGKSRLFGAPHLAYKESSRIEATAGLLRALGRGCEVSPDGIVIDGRPFGSSPERGDAVRFDPRDDHRMAMAAAVAKAAGASVEVLHPAVVNKSFPEFWSCASL